MGMPLHASHHWGRSVPSFLSHSNRQLESPWLGEKEGETDRKRLDSPSMHAPITSTLIRQSVPTEGARKQQFFPPVVPCS